MSFSDWRRKMIGPSEAEALEAVRKRTEQESRRAASESAARMLKAAQDEYAKNPSPLNKAYLLFAEENMP